MTTTTLLLRPIDAARMLGVSSNTLRAWRVEGAGPAFIRLSARMIAYEPAALAAWIEAHRVNAEPTTPRLHGASDGLAGDGVATGVK